MAYPSEFVLAMLNKMNPDFLESFCRSWVNMASVMVSVDMVTLTCQEVVGIFVVTIDHCQAGDCCLVTVMKTTEEFQAVLMIL